MTKNEILAMEAGPELDALVAEKVMGWERHDKCDRCSVSPKHIYYGTEYIGDSWDGKECHPYLKSPGGQKYYLCPCHEQRRDSGPPPPPYSTDIAAAWEVVDALMDNGIGLPQIFHDGQLWVASVSDCTRKKSNMASALTAPLAICRAALLAVMKVEK